MTTLGAAHASSAEPDGLENTGGSPGKPISEAARRALGAAAQRRAAARRGAQDPAEQGGPSGLEPTRYGDWERKGLAVDF